VSELAVLSPININFPLTGIQPLSTLQFNVKQNAEYRVVPFVWFGNNLAFEINIAFVDLEGKRIAMNVGSGSLLPIESIDLKQPMLIDQNLQIVPQLITCAVFLSKTICVNKIPYRGGSLIQFNYPFNIENTLKFSIPLLVKSPTSWDQLHLLLPGSRVPIEMNGLKIAFGFPNPQIAISLSRTDLGSRPLTVFVDRKISCVIRAEVDSVSCCKTFRILPAIRVLSLLPDPLQIQIASTILTLEENAEQDLLEVTTGQSSFIASFALGKGQFSEAITVALEKKDISVIEVPGSTEDRLTRIAVRFAENDGRWTIVFFAPFVIFNQTNVTTFLMDLTSEKEIEIAANGHSLWIPHSALDGEAKTNFALSTEFANQTTVDLTINQVLLEYIVDVDLYFPLSCVIAASSVTLSNLLKVENRLNIPITLLPVINAAVQISPGESLQVDPNQEATILKVTPKCLFKVSIQGCAGAVVVDFLKIQRNALRFRTKKSYRLVLIEISLLHTSYSIVVDSCRFPSPIVIANCLQKEMIWAYHRTKSHSFVTEPKSTSIFAFDGLQLPPDIHFKVNKTKFQVSLKTDTDEKCFSNSFFVTIQRLLNGVCIIFIRDKPHEYRSEFKLQATFSIPAVCISLIDRQFREFAVVSVSNISASCTESSLRVGIQSIQVDDQNPFSTNPVVVHGRGSGAQPFLQLDAVLCHSTAVEYISLLVQRLDVQLDTSFLSDVMLLANEMVVIPREPIKPAQPHATPNVLVTLHWLEVSPIYVLIGIKAFSGRPSVYGSMDSRLRLVPNISGLNMIVPGVVLNQITDDVVSIAQIISADYKTALLQRVVTLLGTSGKMLTAFGVTEMIAKLLNISTTSELNSVDQSSTQVRSDKMLAFLDDLREKLNDRTITPTQTILGLCGAKDVGLKVRTLDGRAIAGVLNQPSIDTMDEFKLMGNTCRLRIPRVFVGSSITELDQKVSHAQLTIQQAIKNFERIELVVFRQREMDYLCATNRHLIVLDESMERLNTKVKFTEMCSVQLRGESFTVSYGRSKQSREIDCESRETAMSFASFIQSQIISLELFTR
jgi:hypothetical protein